MWGLFIIGRPELVEYNVWRLLEICARNIVEKLLLKPIIPLFHQSKRLCYSGIVEIPRRLHILSIKMQHSVNLFQFYFRGFSVHFIVYL